jgi:hypothetical protein
MMSKLLASVTVVITLSVGGVLAAEWAGAAAKDPKTAKELAALLEAKKLGCKNFTAESTPAPDATTSTASTASTIPPQMQALFSFVGHASFGTCTINGQQTGVVVFKDGKARQQFEDNVRGLPCPIVAATLGRFTPPTTQGVSPSTVALKIPVVEVGSRGMVISIGTAPDSEQLDFVAAAATDAKIATKVKGKVQTFTFQCS